MPARPIHSTILATLLLAAPAAAQLSLDSWIVDPHPALSIERCNLSPTPQRGAAWARVLGVLDSPRPEEGMPDLLALEDSLGAELERRPDDVPLRYLKATSVAVRADVLGGMARIRAAAELNRQLQALLELDPDHPGAQHLMGRLHAGVMRLDRVTRFLATRLLGAGELSSASWDEAERLLSAAAEGDPCVPDHHYELAQLYADRGRPQEALRELRLLFALDHSHGRYEAVADKAVPLLEELRQLR